MKILRFISGLLPNFERSRILEDIAALEADVRENLLPSYKAAVAITHGKPFASQQAKDFNEVFVMSMPEYRRVGFLGGMLNFYTSLGDKLESIEKMIPELFAKDVTKESITYRKAAILQYLSAVRFINDYSGRSLLRFLAAEQNASTGRQDQIDSQLPPAELKWLTENQQAYLQAVKLLSIPVRDLTTALNSIPEIAVVPDRYDVVAQTVGLNHLDPMKLNLISGNWNPIYFLRSVMLEHQIETHKRNKELKRALELRLLALKQAYAGTQDAKLLQQIEYVEGRVAKLNQAIEELERSA